MAQCEQWHGPVGSMTRCPEQAAVVLINEKGQSVGNYCLADADAAVAFYRAKFRERWTTGALRPKGVR
jgi:hypothetical protein